MTREQTPPTRFPSAPSLLAFVLATAVSRAPAALLCFSAGLSSAGHLFTGAGTLAETVVAGTLAAVAAIVVFLAVPKMWVAPLSTEPAHRGVLIPATATALLHRATQAVPAKRGPPAARA